MTYDFTNNAEAFSAAEAKKMSENKPEPLFDEIMNNIRKSAKDGKTETYYYYLNSDNVSKKLLEGLRSLGYTVKYNIFDKMFKRIRISWNNKNEK